MTQRRLLAFAILLLMLLSQRGWGTNDRKAWSTVRRLHTVELLKRWSFDASMDGWAAQNKCRLSLANNDLVIVCDGEDPYLVTPVSVAGKTMIVRLRARCDTGGDGQLFWASPTEPYAAEERSRRFKLTHDNQWHEYDVPLEVGGALSLLRLDPGSGVGRFELDWLEIHRAEASPIRIEDLVATAEGPELRLHNATDKPVPCSLNGVAIVVKPGNQSVPLSAELSGPYPIVNIHLQPQGHAALRRTAVLPRPESPHECVLLASKLLRVKVARDGSGAQILLDGQPVALLAPLLLVDGAPTPLSIESHQDSRVELTGVDVSMSLEVEGDEIHVDVKSTTDRTIEAPVLRVLGSLEQGLFAGLEYLGKGEASSSTLDIETEARLRFAPDPLKVTLPLMAVRTDRAMVALNWQTMSLRPVFSSPNHFDGTPDHLMALRGREISATVRVRAAGTVIEETVLWAVNKLGGLPPLPVAPRTHVEQLELSHASLVGPIAGTASGGWGHCAEEKWARHYYADIASTLWRISGEVPPVPKLVAGGAHVPNDAIYFVSGRAGEWLHRQRSAADRLLTEQQQDGGFRYRGKYRKGHFEDSSSGHCALRASQLLEIARTIGDAKALAAGVNALEYMKRFRTPRGAQTWELSLHTPDILASAYLVWAYTRGYELTGEREYLAHARRWALSGIPFVYLWDRYPVMRYATPPVFGATNWKAPLWIGLPVQWCGGVYAYALTMLAAHDDTLDWTHLARGILLAGEQIQYPDGPLIGCLPDIFELSDQRRAGPSINPCALVSLRLALEGQVDSLAVATGDGHRIVAPFEVKIQDGVARVKGRVGTRYQVIIDGVRVVDVDSKGLDAVLLN